ncbi:hypothetical protein [Anabaena azotica]|uniref:Uncharacterized protein n=1 Tax=Anabaena azotica FACHB-119 TaxID=947527 RepID=A0ABR8DDY8_9NOST|nr:hypothetical protein [Anabaena azotica]MBD2505329.1 hypothetical protein [Anabaena azotica FACHB-119]
MDYGVAIRNPVAGHSSTIDAKSLEWGGFQSDILGYLSDIKNLEQFADLANNACELAERLDPFLENARLMMEAMKKLSEGQITWTELRKQYGSAVANAIAKARRLDAEFSSEMERLDAQDRSSMALIEQKRKNALIEIATGLKQDLEAELWRHEQSITNINSRNVAREEREQVTTGLREQRQALLNRARYGSRALNPGQAQEVIPVQVAQPPVANSVSATGEQRGGWGTNLRNLWNSLGNR